MSKATPRPWIAYKEGIGWGIECADHYRIAWVVSEPGTRAADDAALIVSAVNAHDELVAVLRQLVEHPGSHNATEAARAALAKVGS